MEYDVNPFRALPTEITHSDFEVFCMDTLKAYAKQEALKDFVIKHNKKIEAPDSTYQIDVLAEYTALGCKNTVIVECKKYSRNIERSKVAELYEKVQSTGAQKGILISTSGFQSGAVKYAGVHGIALWQICDRRIKHITASASPQVHQHMFFQLEMDKYLPPYFMMEWDCNTDFPVYELYPTPEIYKNAGRKVAEAHQCWKSTMP